MRIAIVAALPGELKPLVRGWEKHSSGTKGVSIWKSSQNGDELIAVCGGMGASAATRSFAAAEMLGAPDLVLSVGWAGALDSGMRTGQCYIPSAVVDVQTGERFQMAEGGRQLLLATTPQVADRDEKRRLWRSYGAALVDMESATIARLAQIRQIPLCCFKAVSDGPDARLPNLNRFIDGQGQMRMASFLAHVALQPRFWKPLARLGRNSGLAADALAEKINKFLLEKNVQRTNRTGAV
ncbi:MAG: nucleoside phosphorylase [Acidobacteria bacterium]|nr:nucleoside phosphorylase [Acidobacteriota bacterium]